MISHNDNPISKLICPITLELMEKAVSVVVDGKLISYDKKALETWFEKNNGKKIDPKSNKEIEAGPFDNIELQNLIDEYKSKLILNNNKNMAGSNKIEKQIQNDLADLFKWTTEGHLIEVEKLLKKNSQLSLMEGTFTDLSENTFIGFTGYQYALWSGDREMQAVYERYLSKKDAEAQKNLLVTDPGKYEQHGLHFDITPLIPKMQNFIEHRNDWSTGQCENYWINKIGSEQRKFPAWLVYAICEEGYNTAWTKNDLKNMKVQRQYDKGHLKWWFSPYIFSPTGYNLGKLGEYWAASRGRENKVSGIMLVAGWRAIMSQAHYSQHDVKVIQSIEVICFKALNEYKSNLILNNNCKEKSDNESGISFEFDNDGKPKKTIIRAVCNQPDEHVKIEVGNVSSSDPEVLKKSAKNFGGGFMEMIRSGQSFSFIAESGKGAKNSSATLSLFNVSDTRQPNDSNTSKTTTLSMNNINSPKNS